jgi:hypothetical protein
MKDQPKQIVVGLGAKGADARELDELTASLGNELRQIDVRSVERISAGQAPPGSKGDPFTIGWLAVTLTPIVAPKVMDILADWVKRVQGRSIKVTIGQNTIELPDATPKERAKLLNKWLKEADRGHST